MEKLSQTVWYSTSNQDQQEGLLMRILGIASARPQFGYERIQVLLKREGWQINVKRA